MGRHLSLRDGFVGFTEDFPEIRHVEMAHIRSEERVEGRVVGPEPFAEGERVHGVVGFAAKVEVLQEEVGDLVNGTDPERGELVEIGVARTAALVSGGREYRALDSTSSRQPNRAVFRRQLLNSAWPSQSSLQENVPLSR